MNPGKRKSWLAASILLTSCCLLQFGCAPEIPKPDIDAFDNDPEARDYLFAQGMRLPPQNREKIFFANENRANFTAFENVKNVVLEDGKLSFILTDKKATLGWGNYMNKQPVAEIVDAFDWINNVHLQVKPPAGESKWTARFWLDGAAEEQTETKTLTDSTWQEIVFDTLITRKASPNASPDGLELVIEGQAGERIEIEWLKLTQPVYEGYVRTEVMIPEGNIWQAVANVQYANQGSWYNKEEIASQLYINGKLVKRRGAKSLLHLDPVDILPYIKPGKNCFAYYGYRVDHTPPLYLQARVIMESGEIIKIASGPEWKYSLAEKDGWKQPGFDDSEWNNVVGARPPAIQVRNWARQIGIPAYTGLLSMKNPKRKDLFYPDTDEVVVDIYVPRGLSGRRPTLTCYFAKANREGLSELISKTAITAFAEEGDSLIYQINLGSQSRGVYTLALKLTGNDNVLIAQRNREPLIVLHRITSDTIAGTDYREGLDLELEDTVDFSNPNDPHPSVESIMPAPQIGPIAERVMTPRIIEKDGLRYREVTSARRGSGFSYRIEFQHPGSFYYLELEYPDDAKRIIEVVVSSKVEGVWTNSQSGVGAETGGKFLLTNGMKTLRWLHIADPGPHSIDILNALTGERAAAKSLKIYRVKGDLPAIDSGMSRQYGIHTERCFPTSGIGMNFGSGTTNSSKLIKEADKRQTMMQSTIKDLLWIEETGNNYVQYLKFCGQNMHIIATYQYNQINNPFIPMPMVKDSRILPCMKTILANIFDMNNINFYAGVEYSRHGDAQTYVNNAQVAKGADTINMVDAKGRQRYINAAASITANWMHPRQREKFTEFVESLADTFGHLRHFRGVHNLAGIHRQAGYWSPGFIQTGGYENPMEASFDDFSMSLFEKDTGIKLPAEANDPERFAKREKFLSSPEIQQRFFDWRNKKYVDYLADALKTLRKDREDLEWVNLLTLGDAKLYQHFDNSGKSLKTILNEFGLDIDRIKKTEGLWAGRWTTSWQQLIGGTKFPSQDPYYWIARTDPGYISTFDSERNRYVFVRTSWDENFLMSGNYALEADRGTHDYLKESDWIMNVSRIRVLPQPTSWYAREAYTQAIITADPEILGGGWTDININVGHEQMLRGIVKPFTHLPKEKFSVVLNTGLDTNLVIRQLSKGGETYIYVANPGYWHIDGKIMLATKGEVFEIPGGKKVELSQRDEQGYQQLPVELTPYGLVAYRISSPQVSISSYQTGDIPGEELAHMNNILTRVEALLADKVVALSLQEDDREAMRVSLATAQQALKARNYSLAWSIMTQPHFWMQWTDFLEKAVEGQAFIPEQFAKQKQTTPANELPSITAHHAAEPVNVDGKIDEAVWQVTPFTTGFWMTTTQKPSIMETGIQVAYDSENLYLAFVCADPDPTAIKADAEEENTIYASKDDVLAFFIQPDENKPLYYQMAFNTKGVQFDQMVKGGERKYDFHPDWKIGIDYGDKYWTVEVAIPLDALEYEGELKEWRMNFHRVPRNEIVAPSSWSFVTGRQWHNTPRFGRVVFEKSGE